MKHLTKIKAKPGFWIGPLKVKQAIRMMVASGALSLAGCGLLGEKAVVVTEPVFNILEMPASSVVTHDPDVTVVPVWTGMPEVTTPGKGSQVFLWKPVSESTGSGAILFPFQVSAQPYHWAQDQRQG